MGLVDMGMINILENYFRLLRARYFDTNEYIAKEINYEELSNCFVYPAEAVQHFGPVDQRMIDQIYHNNTHSAVKISGQYHVVRIGL